MSDKYKTCPKCGADFYIDPTSEEVRKLYSEEVLKLYDDRPPLSRLIVIYDPYEGARYRCPDYVDNSKSVSANHLSFLLKK